MLTAICNWPKQIISASGGLGLLQMVLEPDTEWCVSEDVGLREVDYETPHWLERNSII